MCNPKNYYIYVAHLLYIHAFLHRLPDVQTLLPSYTVSWLTPQILRLPVIWKSHRSYINAGIFGQ